ncbi:MBL fold metallo-hydrolase [Clostridium tyrobutyricum]|uniref:MBL fold metallo-hydrolase n=1 Tax=Clostridium tyrobutyricum TaxID=1519 RepID=UPI0010AB2608|nr:MBL fold metallo-hydrolase [Clostridium tyrobutyricum]MBR9649476.1 MBL fold metallo-hydrolase [Clostridium tyrobutyricum]QCH29489.1 putative metallo-hydrolase YflN [Clostridium tyrobutyricum]
MTELITLPLLFEMEEMKFYIHPVVIKNNDDLILIDTGYPMFLPVIEKAFEKKGLNIRNLQQVILTHHDHDHMGAVKELVKKYPSVKVKCSAEQIPYVLGKKKSLRLEQAEKLGADAGFIQMIKSVEHLDSALAVTDNEIICNGVKVIETSGHMPGHISIYIEAMKTLISGDMLVSEGGVLGIADEQFVLDKEAEINSLKKIVNLDIQKIICFHGGEYKSNNLKEDLKKIIAKGYNKQ